MIDVIKKIINSENSNYMTIIGFCVTIFIAFLTAYLTTKNNKKNTTTDYFKKEGITIQKRLLTFWSSLLIYDFDKLVDNYKKDAKLDKNLSQDDVIKKIHQESIIYSSKETNTAIATYQQFSYKKVVSDSKRKKIKKNNLLKTIRNMQTLVVTLRVAKRMKYDFTGEKIDTLDLLKIRVNDLDIKKKIFARYFIIYYFIKEQLFKVLLFAIVIILTFIYLKGKKLF